MKFRKLLTIEIIKCGLDDIFISGIVVKYEYMVCVIKENIKKWGIRFELI